MAKGISINFLADVRDFLKGTKNVEDSLDDVADSLDDVVKDGDQATEKLEDSFRELANAAKKSGDDVGDYMKQGFKKASDSVDNFKQEANSTAKESAASFDGSAESIVGSFQEIAANAFEGFGPAGAIAGLAVAAGIGIATAEFQKSEEAAKAAKERVRELGLAFIESGADTAQIEAFQEALQGIITNADDAAVKIDDLRKFTDKYGKELPSVSQFATAYAGNADAIELVTEKLEEAIQAEKDKNFEWDRSGREVSKDKIKAWRDEVENLDKIQAEVELAAQIEADWLASGGAEAQAKADAIGQIDAAYDEAVYSVENFKNAETGIYDLEAYAQSIRDREALLLEYQGALAESGLTTEQKAALNEMGVEQANAILKGLQDPATSEQTKTTIKNGLKTASKEGSGVAQKEIEEAFKKPISAKIEAKADTTQAEVDLTAITKKRVAQIQVDFIDRYGKRVY
jgi:hypothetical protein